VKVSPITTHVLDISIGRPAEGVPITLDARDGSAWRRIGEGKTDADGRLKTLLPPGTLRAGVYRITFDIGAYFGTRNVESFYPEAAIAFSIVDASQHYHVPLLLSPYGYSTYRGS
jgi:5-hydroxyisourate hydrolase